MRFISSILIVALLVPSVAWAHCETCPSDEGAIVVYEPTPTYYYDTGTGRSPGPEAAAALLGLVVMGAVVLYFAQFHQPRAVVVTSQNYVPPPVPQYQYQQPYQQQYYPYESYGSYSGASRGNYGGYYYQQQPAVVNYGYYNGYSRGNAPCPPQSNHGYSRVRR